MPSSIHPTIASGNLPRISANLLNRLIGDKTGKFKEEKLLGSRQQCDVCGDWRQDGEIERRKTADSCVWCMVGTVGTVGEQVVRRRYIVFHFPQTPFSLWISFHSLWDYRQIRIRGSIFTQD